MPFKPDPFIRDLADQVGNYDVITTHTDLQLLVDRLMADDLPIAFDIETGYEGPDQKKGSLDVYNPRQFIVGFALTNSVDWARYIPLRHDFCDFNLDPKVAWAIVKPLLETKEIVAHNWVFEARNVALLATKGDGPRIDLDWRLAHDTMIQSYVLNETPQHGLKDLVLARYGYAQKHFQDLFDKAPTLSQQQAQRTNVLDVNQEVINYVCDDVCWALRLHLDQHQRCLTERKIVYRIEREILGILLDMAEVGIAVDWDGIATDFGRFEFFYDQMENRTRQMFEEATGRSLTTLNFRSALQMRKLLFDDMGLHSTRMTKPNKDGAQSLSTDETALEALRHQHPAVDQLLKYRQTKKMGEWFELWSTLRTAHDERVHPSFNQVRVQSGRFASDGPNVQNITKRWWFSLTPREPDESDEVYEHRVRATGTNGVDYWAGNARDFLVATPGYTLLTFDYQAAEMRVLAGLSEEPYLIDAFRTGKDVHKVAASLAFHVPIEQVSKEQRQRAKSVQFGLVYGQGPQGLADGLGISKDEAREIMDQYFSAFSKVDQWFDRQKRDGAMLGYVESFLGRRSTLWDLFSTNRAIQSKAERMMVNIPVQGGAADYCKLAMIMAKRVLTKHGWWQTKVRMLMNQHDSLVFEVDNTLDIREVRDILTPAVSFPLPTDFPTLPPMEVDWETGHRWGSVTGLSDDPPPALPAAAPDPDPQEVLVIVTQQLTRDLAAALRAALSGSPGPQPVYVHADGREVLLRGTSITLTDDLRAHLAALNCRAHPRHPVAA